MIVINNFKPTCKGNDYITYIFEKLLVEQGLVTTAIILGGKKASSTLLLDSNFFY